MSYGSPSTREHAWRVRGKIPLSVGGAWSERRRWPQEGPHKRRQPGVVGLTLDRIAFDFGTIRIDRQLARSSRAEHPVWGPPKTESSTRTIPIADVVVDAISTHVRDFGHHESGLLFTTDVGAFIGTSTLHGAWQRAATRVGTDATPHDLRHYFASVQIRGGLSIKVLQALLGHKSAVRPGTPTGT